MPDAMATKTTFKYIYYHQPISCKTPVAALMTIEYPQFYNIKMK
jgi:hypothetical protein